MIVLLNDYKILVIYILVVLQSIGFRTKTIYQMWTIYNSNNGPNGIMNR